MTTCLVMNTEDDEELMTDYLVTIKFIIIYSKQRKMIEDKIHEN